MGSEVAEVRRVKIEGVVEEIREMFFNVFSPEDAHLVVKLKGEDVEGCKKTGEEALWFILGGFVRGRMVEIYDWFDPSAERYKTEVMWVYEMDFGVGGASSMKVHVRDLEEARGEASSRMFVDEKSVRNVVGMVFNGLVGREIKGDSVLLGGRQ